MGHRDLKYGVIQGISGGPRRMRGGQGAFLNNAGVWQGL